MLHQQVYSKSFAVSTSISTEQSDNSPVKVKDAWLLGETEATRSQKYPNEDPLPPARNKSGAKPLSSVVKPRVRDMTEVKPNNIVMLTLCTYSMRSVTRTRLLPDTFIVTLGYHRICMV